MNTDTMGVYGNYYLKRAIVAQIRSWRKSARGRNLSAQSQRRHRPAARRLEQIYASLREERDAAGECLLVRHPLRVGGLPGREPAQSFRGEQLDAVQVRPRRCVDSLFPEREPRQRQGGQLASRTERGVIAERKFDSGTRR
jgi:hypothetical protein